MNLARYLTPCLLATATLAGNLATAQVGDPDARRAVVQALAEAVEVPRQAEALVRLAWGAGPTDPLVRAEARAELVRFGHLALPALRQAIRAIDPLYQADVTRALIDARRQQRSGNPADYLPALEEAIWFGSIEARRMAMIEISSQHYPPAVLTTIDAIHEQAELTLQGLRTLGRLGDPRGRFFLKRVVEHGDPRYQRAAAVALGQIDEIGPAFLRELAVADDPATRSAAIDALLPYATPDDLTLLHEYVALHGGDDPAVMARVRERAVELEGRLEEQQRSEAASGGEAAVPPPKP